MADVFISYRREDRAFVEQLAGALARLGFSVWWDFELLSGEKFRDTIETVIDKCSAAIVVWSDRSRNSTFVVDEATFARDQGKLCPIRIDSCRLPLGFGGDHVVDLRDWQRGLSEDRLAPLVRALEVKVGRGARSAEVRQEELEAFKRTQLAGDVSSLGEFLEHYPRTSFEEFVRGQIKQREVSSSKKPSPRSASTSWSRVAGLAAIFCLAIGFIVPLVPLVAALVLGLIGARRAREENDDTGLALSRIGWIGAVVLLGIGLILLFGALLVFGDVTSPLRAWSWGINVT